MLIADEVQAGAGRAGKMWSIEHAGVEPDMMTFGKGMGGDLPMAGLMMRRDLAVQLDDHSQPQTFAANALSAEVCMTNLEIIVCCQVQVWLRILKLRTRSSPRRRIDREGVMPDRPLRSWSQHFILHSKKFCTA